jgi:hypothetical protein
VCQCRLAGGNLPAKKIQSWYMSCLHASDYHNLSSDCLPIPHVPTIAVRSDINRIFDNGWHGLAARLV